MIEVNLLPGGKKGRRRKGFGFTLKIPSLGGGGGPDYYVLFAIVAGLISLGYMGWAFMGVRGEAEELQVRLDAALQDSIRFADLIERTNQLMARRDSIAQRVAIIQEIDADRYTWPHIMDEVSRALPDYTWLTQIYYQSTDPLEIRIAGRAGSIPAITAFMRNLEASRFLRAVNPESMVQVPSEVDPEDLVYTFELVATYDPPPLEELETVPLFGEEVSTQLAVPDSAGN